MIFLALSILSSAAIYVVFKLIDHHRVFTFSAIVINYLVACLAGFFLSTNNPFTSEIFAQSWLPIAMLVGVMFIVMFYIIAISTRRAGVAVTTVAVKMSVVFPIAFSIWYDANDKLSVLKLIGIALALLSVFLTVYKKSGKTINPKAIFLPVFLFLGMGIVDSFVKYAQSAYITGELASAFSSVVFGCSLVVGLFVLPFSKPAKQSIVKAKTWLLGIMLGLANFGSIYFLLLALNHIDIDTGQQAMGSVIFGINNIGIVALSVIIGFIAYRERPSRLNWVGIAMSGISIFVLALS